MLLEFGIWEISNNLAAKRNQRDDNKMKNEPPLKPYAYQDLLLLHWHHGETRPSMFKIFVNDIEVPKPVFGIKLSDNTECLLVARVNDLSFCKKVAVKISDESGDKIASATKRILKPFVEHDFKLLPLQDRFRIWEGLLNKTQKTFPAVSDQLIRKIASWTASKDAYCKQLSPGLLYFHTAWPNTEPSRVIDTNILIAFPDGSEKCEKIEALVGDSSIHCVVPIPEDRLCNEILLTLNDSNRNTVALKFPNAKKLPAGKPENNGIVLKRHEGSHQAIVNGYIRQRMHNHRMEGLSLYNPEKDGDGPVYVTIDSTFYIEGMGLFVSGSIVDPQKRIRSISLHSPKTLEVDLLKDSIKAPRPSLHSRFLGQGIFLNSCALGFHSLIPDTTQETNASTMDFTMHLDSDIRYRLPSIKTKILGPKVPLPADISFALLEQLQAKKRPIPPEKRIGLYQSLNKWAANSESSLHIDSTPLIKDPVYLFLDTAINIPKAGLFLSGWKIDLGQNIASIKVMDLNVIAVEISDKLISAPRPDVYDHFHEKGLSLMDNEVGFHCLVPISSDRGGELLSHLKISCKTGEIYRLPIKVETPNVNKPLSVIKKMLLTFSQNHHALRLLLDECIGPAVHALWSYRQVPDIKLTVTSFGKLPNKPEVSIIVPLYGRIDFVLHQLSLFADDPDFQENELIYVLDDPPLYSTLIQKCHDMAPMFRVPFKLVYTGYNMGFGGANNIGAQHANGKYLVLLNSDVMPKESGWITKLTNIYEKLPRVGAIGTKLLFADGSIQHAGMAFEKSTTWDGLWLNDHPGKGHPNKEDFDTEPQKITALTAACIMLKRSIFIEIGGFTDDYIIGDFEDSDLCLKIQEKGYQNWYIPSVELYHLERQSQSMPGESHWRFHLTLYNCWVQTRKWGAQINEIKTKGDNN